MRDQNKPRKDEVALYGFIARLDEVYKAVMTFEKQITELLEKHKPVGVNRPLYYEIFLYCTPEERNEAFTAFHEYFPNAKVIANPAFVKKKYLKKGETEE